jgi:hypothetical protein
MKQHLKISLLGLSALILFAGSVFSQITKKKVTFPAGKTSTQINGSIKGQATVDYQLSAKEGQTLSISLVTKNTSNYFNLLPPGSNDEADFVGSSDGNSYSGTVSSSGVWTIRVYLMRNAARRNEIANYTLKIGLTGGNGSGSATGDAKVPGTNYNATGQVKAYLGDSKTPVNADFGVIRMGQGNAEIHATVPNSMTHKFQFKDNKWSCLGGCSIKASRINSYEWRVTIDGYTSYIIDNAIIYGG